MDALILRASRVRYLYVDVTLDISKFGYADGLNAIRACMPTQDTPLFPKLQELVIGGTVHGAGLHDITPLTICLSPHLSALSFEVSVVNSPVNSTFLTSLPRHCPALTKLVVPTYSSFSFLDQEFLEKKELLDVTYGSLNYAISKVIANSTTNYDIGSYIEDYINRNR